MIGTNIKLTKESRVIIGLGITQRGQILHMIKIKYFPVLESQGVSKGAYRNLYNI